MKAWLALLRREWWEHVLGFGWTPLAIAVLAALLTGYLLAMSGSASFDISFHSTVESGRDIATRDIAWNDALLRMLDISQWTDVQLEHALDMLLYLVAQPFIYAHFLVALMVLPSMLHDDRRDRSVLFWKSMPVSDLSTVTSKLTLVAWAAPLATIAAIFASWLAVLGMVTALSGTGGGNGIGRLWLHAELPGSLFGLLIGYLLQGLWALPVYAWLLLVSAAVSRGPVVWAVLVPLVPLTLERLLLGQSTLWEWIYSRFEFVALPRPSATLAGQSIEPIGIAEQLALLGSLDFWLGVVVGGALLAGAVYFRGRNNDL